MVSVSIGVPVFNEEKTLRCSLDSIISSALNLENSFDLILCFNGTTDGGREIAEDYSRNVYPLRIVESGKGKPSAMKKIGESSDADYLFFVDADVVVDEFCFKRLASSYKEGVVAVTGRPIPYKEEGFLYNVLNARMINGFAEVSRKDGGDKSFLHGRIYGVRKKVFDELSSNFLKNLGDDTFLSHYLMLNYGRGSVVCCKGANVFYQPVTSVKSWWNKWSRIWSDIDKMYVLNPEDED
jgi:glycosyltransferase involved in cell wall biosynthesis